MTTCVGPGSVEVMTLVDGGMTMVEKEVEIDVEVIVTVRSDVLVTTDISTRVIVGPSRVCVGPGTVCTEVGPSTV